MIIKSSDTGSAGIYLGDQSDEIRGGLIFDNSTDTLQLRASDNNTAITIDSSERVGIGTSSPSQKLTVSSGTASSPAVNLLGAGASQGWLRLGNNADIKGGDDYLGMTFTVGASERLRIDSSGRVGIGTSSPNSKLHVKDSTDIAMSNDADGQFVIEGSGYSGAIALNATGMQIYQNSSARSLILGTNETARITINGSGGVNIASSSGNGYLSVPQAYTGTTGSAANMHILSSGVFLRSVSSGKYKTGIEDAEMSYAEELYNLRPVYYKSLGTFDNPDHSHWGFIAEEVAEIDPRLCLFKTTEPDLDDDGNIQRDDDGNIIETTLDEPVVEGVQYDRIIPLLLMLLKGQKERIETLEAQNADFETRIAALEAN